MRQGKKVLNISDEIVRLDQANNHIAEAARRVDTQRALVASLQEGSEGRSRAESLLRTMLATLTQFEFHRRSIVESIDRLRKQGLDGSPQSAEG